MQRPRMRFTARRTIALVAVAGVMISSVVALVVRVRAEASVDPLQYDRLTKALRCFPHDWLIKAIYRLPEGAWLEYSFLEWWCLGILMTAAACAVLALAGAIWQGRFRRITMRHLMGIVAIAGVLSAAAANLRQRSRYLERVALDHLKERQTIILSDLEMYLFLTEAQFGERLPEESEAIRRASVAAYRERHDKIKSDFEPIVQYINYHEGLSEKYKHAAARPWFPVRARPPGAAQAFSELPEVPHRPLSL